MLNCFANFTLLINSAHVNISIKIESQIIRVKTCSQHSIRLRDGPSEWNATVERSRLGDSRNIFVRLKERLQNSFKIQKISVILTNISFMDCQYSYKPKFIRKSPINF